MLNEAQLDLLAPRYLVKGAQQAATMRHSNARPLVHQSLLTGSLKWLQILYRAQGQGTM